MKEKKPVNRYSMAFKMRVIEDVENGLICAEDARKLYGIGGRNTVHEWIAQYGRNQKLGKVIHIMTKDEELEVIALRREVKLLKRALEEAFIEKIALETLVEMAENETQVPLKKNFGSQASELALEKWKKWESKERSG